MAILEELKAKANGKADQANNIQEAVSMMEFGGGSGGAIFTTISNNGEGTPYGLEKGIDLSTGYKTFYTLDEIRDLSAAGKLIIVVFGIFGMGNIPALVHYNEEGNSVTVIGIRINDTTLTVLNYVQFIDGDTEATDYYYTSYSLTRM